MTQPTMLGLFREQDRGVAAACAGPLPDSSPTRGSRDAHPVRPATPMATALFVATDLQCWETNEPEIYATDVEVDGGVYRKLDSAYYAWLWSRVRIVIAAYGAHRIERPAFDQIITPWCAIYHWALDTWHREALDAAQHGKGSRIYTPPRAAAGS
jgi:hypothetical protein